MGLTPPVTVIIPTFDNLDLLAHAVKSFVEYTGMGDPEAPNYHILIVNNGQPGSVQRRLSAHPIFTVIEAGENKGWEGGLVLGLKADINGGKSPFVMFLNDDVHVPPNDSGWLTRMLATCHRDGVAAVGPVSNFVMGWQHIQSGLEAKVYEAKLLIGFCLLVRREALEEVGGVALGLPGGDDFDLCLRFAAKGWKMAIQGDVYLHHWGCTTGNRVHPGYWNSSEMKHATRNEMIRRHKLRPYIRMLNHRPEPLT